MTTGTRTYLPSLEGIRTYAFLLVFAVHYSGQGWDLAGKPVWAYPWFLACQLSFVALPIFFALSGYLITGILVDTRESPGYFRVFYLRRALRIFPLYYAVLLVLGCILLAQHAHFLLRDALFLVYLHNLWPNVSIYSLSPSLYIAHFWSLAVEEQFYFLWPIAVWLLPTRRSLLGFSYCMIAMAFVGRLCWPLLHMNPGAAYQNTLFRFDAIMLGAVLALHVRGPAVSVQRLARPASIVLAAGALLLVCRALAVGQALPYDYFGIAIIMPLLSLMGACVLVLTLAPGHALRRVSEQPWAVSLGKLSYGLYVIHQLFAPLFLDRVIPYLSRWTGQFVAHVLGMVVAFSITYVLSVLAYQFIEKPALTLKNHIRYRDAGMRRRAEPLLAKPFSDIRPAA